MYNLSMHLMLKQQNFSFFFLLSYYHRDAWLLDESIKAKESNESEKLDGSLQNNLTFRWKACLGQCRVYSGITNSRESNSKGGEGGKKCQANIIVDVNIRWEKLDRFRQSNFSLKLVEKEKKIIEQIRFDRKQTNEIKSNDYK